MPTIRKTVNGRDVSHRGAFPYGTKIEITVEVPRSLGASAVVLRLEEDGKGERDIPLSFADTSLGRDIYKMSLDTKEICSEERNGLFYYELLFLRGADTLFTNTHNFVDYTLWDRSAGKFILLVYKEEYETPEWFKGRVMYHIFVDRFNKGVVKVAKRDDAIINEDWDNGIMQFPEKSGDKLANNMFFGGTLWGIAEKLDYLRSLGVGVIYLSPIFKAYSNHKYDTGDYLEVDEMFGGNEAFEHLLKTAAELDIKIILDGVFNHTGDDSLYFDKYGKYGESGAYSNPKSPYKSWYHFSKYPDKYETWWGIQILPKLDHSVAKCRKFFTGKGGVCEKYVKMGIGGWRLDVADELSDTFLDELRATVKKVSDGEAVIIGEVWENAAEKISYSRRRRYLRGDQLDSVMNYPVRNGIISLVVDKNATLLADTLRSIYASYPKCVCDSLMNVLGTHDTERILTVLGDMGRDLLGYSNRDFSTMKMDNDTRALAIKRLKLAATVQYTVYGVPSVFYGDEAGIEGYGDPFCRRTFPWGKENEELLEHYRRLGAIREKEGLFADGDFTIDYADGALIAFSRRDGDRHITVIANASEKIARYPYAEKATDMLTGREYDGTVEPLSAVILG